MDALLGQLNLISNQINKLKKFNNCDFAIEEEKNKRIKYYIKPKVNSILFLSVDPPHRSILIVWKFLKVKIMAYYGVVTQLTNLRSNSKTFFNKIGQPSSSLLKFEYYTTNFKTKLLLGKLECFSSKNTVSDIQKSFYV